MSTLFNLLIIVGTILAIIGTVKMPKELRQQQRRTFLLKMHGPGTMIMKIGMILVMIGAVALLF